MNCLVFQKEFLIEDSLPIPSHTTSPSLDEDRPLVWLVVVHFICPMVSSVLHYCTIFTFPQPSQFIVKMKHFHYSRELHEEIVRKAFSTFMETKPESN